MCHLVTIQWHSSDIIELQTSGRMPSTHLIATRTKRCLCGVPRSLGQPGTPSSCMQKSLHHTACRRFSSLHICNATCHASPSVLLEAVKNRSVSRSWTSQVRHQGLHAASTLTHSVDYLQKAAQEAVLEQDAAERERLAAMRKSLRGRTYAYDHRGQVVLVTPIDPQRLPRPMTPIVRQAPSRSRRSGAGGTGGLGATGPASSGAPGEAAPAGAPLLQQPGRRSMQRGPARSAIVGSCGGRVVSTDAWIHMRGARPLRC